MRKNASPGFVPKLDAPDLDVARLELFDPLKKILGTKQQENFSELPKTSSFK